LALEFAAHVVIGGIAFVLIALVAFGLKVFVDWAESWAKPDGWMLDTLRFVEHGIFVVDVLTFSVYVLVTAWNFCAALYALWERPPGR
jgi:hypothetical protein